MRSDGLNYAQDSAKHQSRTVGTYSLGNLLVVYEINRHVYSRDREKSAPVECCSEQVSRRRRTLPTAPSPTTTHLIVCMALREVYGIERESNWMRRGIVSQPSAVAKEGLCSPCDAATQRPRVTS